MVKPAKGSTLLQVGTSVRLSVWVFSVLQKTLRIICLNKVFKLWKVKKSSHALGCMFFSQSNCCMELLLSCHSLKDHRHRLKLPEDYGGKGSLNCGVSKNIYLVLVCGNLHRRSRFSRLKKDYLSNSRRKMSRTDSICRYL